MITNGRILPTFRCFSGGFIRVLTVAMMTVMKTERSCALTRDKAYKGFIGNKYSLKKIIKTSFESFFVDPRVLI